MKFPTEVIALKHPGQRLRDRLASPRLLEGPCVYDAMTAIQSEIAGYDFVVLGAGGTANFLYGLPDMGLLSLSEVIGNISRVANASGLPVVADLDDAGGTPAHIERNVRLAESAGAAALMIEDVERATKHQWSETEQGWDLSTDTLRPVDAAVEAIQIACSARQDPRTMILGRTDAYLIEGGDAAVSRAAALAAAGADLIMMTQFPGQLVTRDVVKAISAPLMHAESEGPPPEFRTTLADAGVRGLVYALEPLLGAFFGFRAALERIKTNKPRFQETSAWEENKELLATVGLQHWTSRERSSGA